jgi:peptidoglycan/xylan/chitin deacetylase (PgdA/CDA1 family)
VRVALTFDAEHPDRPGCAPGVAEKIVDLLAERAVAATFFLQGRWVEAYPEVAARIVEDGHAVGSHSFYHAHMPLLSDAGLARDVAHAEEAIRSLAGADPRPWFRCPWGGGWDDERVLAALERAGYRHVGWDVMASDWEPDRSPDEVRDAVMSGVLIAAESDVTVLLHTWPESTLLALPGILDALGDSRAELVRIDELRTVTRAVVWSGAPEKTHGGA